MKYFDLKLLNLSYFVSIINIFVNLFPFRYSSEYFQYYQFIIILPNDTNHHHSFYSKSNNSKYELILRTSGWYAIYLLESAWSRNWKLRRLEMLSISTDYLPFLVLIKSKIEKDQDEYIDLWDFYMSVMFITESFYLTLGFKCKLLFVIKS